MSSGNYNTISFVREFSRGNRKKLAFVYTLIIISSFLGYIMPFFLKKVIDDIVPSGNIDKLHIVFISLISLLLFKSMIDFIKNKVNLIASEFIVRDIKFFMFDKLKKVVFSQLQKHHSGYLFNRIYNEIDEMDEFITMFFFNIVYNFVSLIVGGAVIYYFSPLFLFLIIIFLPFFSLPYAFFAGKITELEKTIWEKNAKLESACLDYIKVIPYVYMLADAPFFQERIKDRYGRVLKKYLKLNTLRFTSDTLSSIIQFLLPQLIFWLGFYMVIKDSMTLGTIVTIQIYISLFIGPVGFFIRGALSFKIFGKKIERINEILDWNKYDFDIINHEAEKINLQDISFSYSDSAIFDNISFSISKGELRTISGKSGIGKSTLAKIISGLLSPETGTIAINDTNAKMLELQKAVYYCPQYPDFFEGSVFENITFKKKDDITKNEMEFICDWAEKLNVTFDLDKNIKENAKNMSGGEKQKVNILRALFFRKDFLIFDESFSQIDDDTKKSCLPGILDFLGSEMIGVIVITHNIDTLNSLNLSRNFNMS